MNGGKSEKKKEGTPTPPEEEDEDKDEEEEEGGGERKKRRREEERKGKIKGGCLRPFPPHMSPRELLRESHVQGESPESTRCRSAFSHQADKMMGTTPRP